MDQAYHTVNTHVPKDVLLGWMMEILASLSVFTSDIDPSFSSASRRAAFIWQPGTMECREFTLERNHYSFDRWGQKLPAAATMRQIRTEAVLNMAKQQSVASIYVFQWQWRYSFGCCLVDNIVDESGFELHDDVQCSISRSHPNSLYRSHIFLETRTIRSQFISTPGTLTITALNQSRRRKDFRVAGIVVSHPQ